VTTGGDGGGVPEITIDLGGLANAIWSSVLDHLGELGTAIWTNLAPQLPTIGNAIWTVLGQWMYELMRGLLLTLWNATLLPILHTTTDEFGPVQAMLPGTGALAAAGITLALALLGLRTILRGTTARPCSKGGSSHHAAIGDTTSAGTIGGHCWRRWCLELERGGSPLAGLGQHTGGSTDVDFAAGVLPALPRAPDQLGGGDVADGPAELPVLASLARAGERPQRGGVDGDAVVWPGVT
jgi:hypothetical protein